MTRVSGARSLSAAAASNMCRKLRSPRCIQTCARVPSNTHTHSGITFLEMPEPSQGVLTKRCRKEARRAGGERRWGGSSLNTHDVFFGDGLCLAQFHLLSSLLCVVGGTALRHGTLVMLAIMLMAAIRPRLCTSEWGERARTQSQCVL